ncbi:MAG: UbiA family prenyltransferase [Verrucomicrobiota bacterium]
MIRLPMNRSGKLHALLSTARVANIPSVISNVWVGVVLGTLQTGQISIPWRAAGCLLPAGVCLYIAGNFLNDWMDREWDAKHRPERALPRGLFPQGLYSVLAIALGLLGVALAGLADMRSGMVAGGIVFCIVIYTVWHKRTAWAVIPMGLCRALLPVMGFMAFHRYVDYVWPVAAGLFCYIMGLSLSARYESMAEPPKRVAVMARGLLLATAVCVAWGNKELFLYPIYSVPAAVPYLAWTSVCLRYRRKPVPLLVSSLLAGIPLVDWMVLLPVSLSLAAYSGGDWHSLVIVSVLVPPVAFISALLLQRLAPAT